MSQVTIGRSRLTARRCRDSIWQIIWQKISAMADSPQPLPELVSFLETLPEPHILCDRSYRILAANAAYRANCGAGD